MNEIEKMYSNTGIEPTVRDNAIGRGYYIEHQRVEEYPPFTPEKQIELVKWMIKTNHRYFIQDIFADDFSETLAGVFNLYWQDLTEEERSQIKEILK